MKTMQAAAYLVHIGKMLEEDAAREARNASKPLDEHEKGMDHAKWPSPTAPEFAYVYALRIMANVAATPQFKTFISALQESPEMRVIRRGRLNTDVLFLDGRVIDGACTLLRFEIYPVSAEGTRGPHPIRLSGLNPKDPDMHVYTEQHAVHRLRGSEPSDFWGSIEIVWQEDEE